jgi:hypothetical protein
MLKVKCNIDFHRAGAIAAIEGANDKALEAAGMQALKDITKHVPKDQGPLQDSGIKESDKHAENGVFTLRWDTPYAQYLWNGDVMVGSPTERSYGPKKISFTSALAREEWALYAQEVYGENWLRVYEAALQGGRR